MRIEFLGKPGETLAQLREQLAKKEGKRYAKGSEHRGEQFENIFEQALIGLLETNVIDGWEASTLHSQEDNQGYDYFIWANGHSIGWQITSDADHGRAHKRTNQKIKSGEIGMTYLLKGRQEKTVEEVMDELGPQIKSRVEQLEQQKTKTEARKRKKSRK